MSEMQGKKLDQNKPRMSLLPKGVLNAVIRVLEFGATKFRQITGSTFLTLRHAITMQCNVTLTLGGRVSKKTPKQESTIWPMRFAAGCSCGGLTTRTLRIMLVRIAK